MRGSGSTEKGSFIPARRGLRVRRIYECAPRRGDQINLLSRDKSTFIVALCSLAEEKERNGKRRTRGKGGGGGER